jgi:integrase
MGLKKRGSIYWCVFQHAGKSYQVTTRTSNLREAQAFERRYRSEIESRGASDGAVLVPTLRVMMDLDVARAREAGRTEEHIKKGLINQWLRLIAYFPDASHVSVSSIDTYVAHRRKTTRRQTISKELTTLKRGLLLASARKLAVPAIALWPKLAKDAPNPKQRSKSHPTERLWRFVLELKGEAQDMAVLALLTGMREGELRRIQPGDVVDGVLAVKGKSRRDEPRMIPLVPEALLIVSRAPYTEDHKRTFRRASSAVGATGTITLRDCRAAFASAADQAGDARGTDIIMGHSSGVAMRYQKGMTERLMPIMEKVRNLLIPESWYSWPVQGKS